MNEFRFFGQQIRPIVYSKNEVKKTTHQLVLVGRYGRENRLGKDVGAELFRFQVAEGSVVAFDATHQVHSRLVPVHRVQHNL